YHYPFYYIDYCLAQTVSLEFWSMSQKDWNDAWKHYYKFVEQGGKQTFTGLCRTAGIKVPFEDGALKDIAEGAVRYLEK
ncbi:MAG: M3 family oligoendopeptidase, partial [Eubacteriales bacterium]